MVSDELEALIDDFCNATRQYAVTQGERLRNADALAYVRTWEALRDGIAAIETQRDDALARLVERDGLESLLVWISAADHPQFGWIGDVNLNIDITGSFAEAEWQRHPDGTPHRSWSGMTPMAAVVGLANLIRSDLDLAPVVPASAPEGDAT